MSNTITKKTISAIKYTVGNLPHRCEVKNELAELQKHVGGHIEVLPLSDKVALICNEEGKLISGAQPSAYLCDKFLAIENMIFCDALLVGLDGEDFADLDEAYATVKRTPTGNIDSVYVGRYIIV